MIKTLRLLKPFLLLSLPGLILGAAVGLAWTQAWMEGMNNLLPVEGIAFHYPLKEWLESLPQTPLFLVLLALLLILAFGFWLLLLCAARALPGWKAFREGHCFQNLLRAGYLILTPLLLFSTFLIAIGEPQTQGQVQGAGWIAVLLWSGAWVPVALWVRLSEQRAKPFFKNTLLALAQGLAGSVVSFLILLGFQLVNSDLFHILTQEGWLPPTPFRITGLCLAFALWHALLFLALSLLFVLLFRAPLFTPEKRSLALTWGVILLFSILLGGGILGMASLRRYGKNALQIAGISYENLSGF